MDDIQLDPNGKPQVQSNPDNQMLMGRYGNTMLINGSDTTPHVTVVSGQILRLYLTNVANVRPFNLIISPVNQQSSGNVWMKLIGSDIGLYETPTLTQNILI